MKRACFLFWTTLLLIVSTNEVLGEPFPAIFVFGDSLLDNGNNNDLRCLAKANFAPYGIDFSRGPTGRFSNGKTLVDFLGEMMDLPDIPPYAASLDSNISMGVNYASASAGIREETGMHLGQRITFSQQVQNFETTLDQLRTQMDDNTLSQHLAKSLALVNHGSNDYINNYLLPQLYVTSFIYDPKDYADVLIKDYREHIMALHDIGLRKFLLAGVGPLGCIPNQISNGLIQPEQCRDNVNEIVDMFNVALRSLVDELNEENHGSIFAFGNTYDALMEIIKNPSTFGFTVTDSACCGYGRNQGQITCLPLSIPCINREQYVFWDAYHPTQTVNEILAQRAYNGSTYYCYPVNIMQMADM